VTKTPAKTLATSTASAGGAHAAAPKTRAKPATKVSSSADGTAAAAPLKKPSAKADTEPMNAAKSSATDTKLASAWKTKAGKDLTEPELLAMPDSEYMGEKQLEFFRAKLQALKDDLLSNAGETTEHLREDTPSNCARVTASASCSRRSRSRSAASTRATTATATRPASRSAWAACWRVPRPPCRSRRSSAAR
jgi:DnaK suppressor protein